MVVVVDKRMEVNSDVLVQLDKCWIDVEKLPMKVEALQLHVPFIIETLEGRMKGEPGDWIVRGSYGELDMLKDKEFKSTYIQLVGGDG